jgi:hypothetical protein
VDFLGTSIIFLALSYTRSFSVKKHYLFGERRSLGIVLSGTWVEEFGFFLGTFCCGIEAFFVGIDRGREELIICIVASGANVFITGHARYLEAFAL